MAPVVPVNVAPIRSGPRSEHRHIGAPRAHRRHISCLDRRLKRAGKSRQRLNALNAKDRVAGPATLALLVSLWLPWYSVGPFSADGLSVHGWLFIAALNSVVLVLYVLITAFDVGDLADMGRMSKDQLLVLMTGVNVALVVLGFLLKPAGFSWSWGAFLALAAAIVAFLPFGIPFIKAQRRR